jgi:hypothetical protein
MGKNLYAVDQQTGALKWKFVSEGPVVSSPALAGGIVYFASYDGKFYAIHAATGRLEWACETAGERRYAGRHLHGLLPAAETMPDRWNYFLSSPAVWTVPGFRKRRRRRICLGRRVGLPKMEVQDRR